MAKQMFMNYSCRRFQTNKKKHTNFKDLTCVCGWEELNESKTWWMLALDVFYLLYPHPLRLIS